MDKNILEIGADALRKVALNEDAKTFLLENERLYSVIKKAANRYIGGETLKEAVATIQDLNQKGYGVTTDFMGESVRMESEAYQAAEEFLRLAQAINTYSINSSISLDLSHIGLLISHEMAAHHLDRICEVAAQSNQEVIISMEGHDRIDAILDIYKKTLKRHTNLGITLQAYLYRTHDDFKDLIQLPGSIRIVKGAYDTPKSISMERGDTLDAQYMNYVEQLISKNHPCSIATHDEKIHKATSELIRQYQPSNFVLERLLGIRNESLDEYKDRGLPCRIYVVYGKEWYLYLCNRLAEYPLAIFQAVSDIAS